MPNERNSWMTMRQRHSQHNKKKLSKARKKLHEDYDDFADKQISNIPDHDVRNYLTSHKDDQDKLFNETHPLKKQRTSYQTPTTTLGMHQPTKDGRSVPGTALVATGTRDFRQIPSMFTGTQKTNMRYSRSRTRRPLRRRRLRSRRPPARRTRSRFNKRKRKGGIKSLIRRITMDMAEPRRLTINHSFSVLEDSFDVKVLSRLSLQNNTVGLGAFKSNAQGVRTYIKGIRLKGQIKNPSELVSYVQFYMMQNKSKGDIIDWNVPANVAARKMWYNALSGEQDTLANINERFSANPKMAKESPFKIIKKKTWIINANGLDPNVTNPNIGSTEVNRHTLAGTQDIIHFDMYFPINKVISVNTDALAIGEAVAQRWDTEYYMGWMCNPYDYESQYGSKPAGVFAITPTINATTQVYFKEL